MTPKSLAVGLIVVVGLGAGLWWRTRGAGESPDGSGAPTAATGTPGQASTGGATGVEAPQNPTEAPADGTRKEQAPAPEPALELVTPLLELNLVVDGAAGESSADASAGTVDSLLEGRHGTKNRAQLELSLRSIRFVLDQQRDLNSIPKEQILTPEAVRALEIEVAWLKERIYN